MLINALPIAHSAGCAAIDDLEAFWGERKMLSNSCYFPVATSSRAGLEDECGECKSRVS
jgi:hypothetical protein